MKIRTRTLLSLLAVGALALSALPGSVAAAPEGATKTVVLACAQGWRGSGGGSYGGVSFTVFCNNGRDIVHLTGVVGTAYSVRVGAESSSVGIDCFFTGDAANVNESCGQVRLSVR
ncbi:MAG: hypothetical protein SF066_05185 [Thermoanaerobaculia bacterium]|nr:hypothetical protein [Thermoanaerobaculia bacterium]